MTKITTDLIVGPFKYSPEGRIWLSRYVETGEVAICCEDPETGEPLLTASVSMPGEPLSDDQVCIKDWSENEGVPEAFLEAGLLKLTEDFRGNPNVTAGIYEITGPLKTWVDKLPSWADFQNELSERSG